MSEEEAKLSELSEYVATLKNAPSAAEFLKSGFTCTVVTKSSGRVITEYFSKDLKKFRSKVDVGRFLGLVDDPKAASMKAASKTSSRRKKSGRGSGR